MPLINCEVELTLTWSKNGPLADMTVRVAGNNNDLPAAVEPNKSTFQKTDSKLYIALVPLSKENDEKLLEQLKSGFIRTVKCNKYRSPLTVHSNNNNLSYLIDTAFI